MTKSEQCRYSAHCKPKWFQPIVATVYAQCALPSSVGKKGMHSPHCRHTVLLYSGSTVRTTTHCTPTALRAGMLHPSQPCLNFLSILCHKVYHLFLIHYLVSSWLHYFYDNPNHSTLRLTKTVRGRLKIEKNILKCRVAILEVTHYFLKRTIIFRSYFDSGRLFSM